MALDRILLGFSLKEPLPRKYLPNLKKYRYNSVDNSILSKFVLCHYWNALVKLFPLWMAPNLITLIGLMTVVVSAILVVYHAPNLVGALPSWVYYFTGASIWAYASLDAIDGKQARRTGQCGPLGELFDHGCDAVNLALMNLIVPLIFGIPIDGYFMAMAFMLLFGFYVVTWDEYHTHVLYLTVISGPVEGTILFTAASMLSGCYGSAIWSTSLGNIVKVLELTPLGSISINKAIPIFLVLAGFVTINTSLQRVNCKQKNAYLQLIPFMSFLTAVGVCLALEKALWRDIVSVLLYTGSTFAHATASLILSHLLLCETPAFEVTYLPAVFGAVLLLFKSAGYIQFDEVLVLRALHIAMAHAVITYVFRAYLVIQQVAMFLDINCLSIKKHEIKRQ